MRNLLVAAGLSEVTSRTLSKDIRLSAEQIGEIRTNYCSRELNTGSRFCTNDDEIPIWLSELDEESVRLCRQYYSDFHGIDDFSKISVNYLATGGMGMVYTCGTSVPDIYPEITAEKIFYHPETMNLTEMELVKSAVSDAGITAELFWFHDKGYFEEFLDGKSDWQGGHPSGLQFYDKEVIMNSAKRFGQMHSIEIPELDETSYTRFNKTLSSTIPQWNTRDISTHMQHIIETHCNEETILHFANGWGWTYSELLQNIKWVEDLIRNYHNDEERPVLCHNDGHSGNLMMNDDDLTGESLIFVDFDLTQYGYRAFDWIYHLKSASHKLFVQTNGEQYFIPDEELDQWLQIYRSNLVDQSDAELDTLWEEFNVHMPYIALEQSMWKYCHGEDTVEELKYLACKYGEMQIHFGQENPVICDDYPINGSKQCDECEVILVDCLMNCSSNDLMCSSACNREFVICTENCI